MRATVDSGRTFSPKRVTLTENSYWSAYCRPDEIQIECQEGGAWITQEGDSRDIILHAGQRYRIEKRGLVIVQAIGRARILVNEL
jgi:hypothetical protein